MVTGSVYPGAGRIDMAPFGAAPDPTPSQDANLPLVDKIAGVGVPPYSPTDATQKVGIPELADRVQRSFGGYTIERELGNGGMATVYLALDKKHGRKVAIKVVHAEYASVVGAERFVYEIKVTAQLNHPHILGLIDSGTIGDEGGELRGRPYYVMPFVEGESLRERLEREGQLSVDDAVRIATDVAGALDYAHHHGVIHRDIKPGNILLLNDGSAIVADFGIALAMTEAGGNRLTDRGLIVGTVPYMSPEQAGGERTITHRTDVYSLAAVMYEMLSGEPPFDGPTVQAVISRVLMEEPRRLTTRRHRIPAHVEEAVLKALEKVAADRFASAHEFATALTTPVPIPPPPIPLVNLRYLLYGTSATALLFLGLAAWGWMRPVAREQVARNAIVFDSTDALAPVDDWAGRLAISPDGSHLAYVGVTTESLLIRARNQLRGVVAPGTEGVATPVFSPDGNSVAGVVDRKALVIAPVDGGPALRIATPMVGSAGLAWGKGGFIYADANADLLGGGLLRIEPKSGASPQAFTTLDKAHGEADHTWPDVLPNGKGVIFTVMFNHTKAAQPESTSVAVASPSGKHRILINGAIRGVYATSGHLLYITKRNVLMAVPFDQNSLKITGQPIALIEGIRTGTYGSADLAISRFGTLLYGTSVTDRELFWVERDGKMQPVDPGWRGVMRDPVISPDGKRVAVSISNADGVSDVWIKQLDRGPGIKLTVEGRTNFEPTWTPDGRSVTYVSNAGGPLQLWTRSADGTGQAKLELRDQRDLHGPSWSRDSRWLLEFTDFNLPGASDVVGFRPGVDSAPIALIATRFFEAAPQLSPDGRWLAYTSGETGLSQVYVTPFPNTTSGKWAVSSRGGKYPRWSHNGKELFFVDSAGTMTAAEINTRGGFSVVRSTSLFPTHQFWLDNFGSGVPPYAVSPDGRRFLMVRPIDNSGADKVILVENWFEELKARSR